MKTLGDKIKAVRISKSLTQEDVAHELDVSINAYSKIERNRTDVNFSRLEQIAKVFKMSTAEILAYGESDKLFKEMEKLKKIIEKKDSEIRKMEKELRTKDKEIITLHKKLLKSMDSIKK